VLCLVVAPARAVQDAPSNAGRHAALHSILDLLVRDGLVYYRALRSERAKLDRYVASLDVPQDTFDRWPREERAAFWLNAYNALVLRTVIERYPIRGTAAAYPPNSIRQIPGAFERKSWRVAGRAVTLDDIEQIHLAAFGDPRMFFAIGRGAVGGGRLRSEAFEAARLDAQLADVIADCVRRASCARLDQPRDTLFASPIFSWREPHFVAGPKADAEKFPGRSPLELAVLGLIVPRLYPSEAAWLAENRFAMKFMDFDWRLNDLTGGGPG
jgi:hypothetical protein